MKASSKMSPFLAAIAAILWSCDPLETAGPATSEIQLPLATYNETDPAFVFSKALAKSLNDPEIREFVKKKSDEQFDGDYNFLYLLSKNEPIGGPNSKSITFGEALFGPSNPQMRALVEDGLDPLLQVAVPEIPGLEEDWDPGTEHPLVVFLPDDVNMDSVASIPAINQNGEVIQLNHHEYPERPVIVISLNERIVKVAKDGQGSANGRIADNCSTAIFSNSDYDFYMAEEYYNSCWDTYSGGTTGSSTTSTQSCDRASQPTKQDYITQVRFKTMKLLREAEKWSHGAPEVYFVAHTNATDPRYKQIKKIIPEVDRSRWKDCGLFKCKPEWYFVDLPVVRWDRMDFSDRIVYYWYETDGETGTKTTEVTNTFKDPITGITTTVKTTTVTQVGDADLGYSHVEYCDKSSSGSEIYTTGTIDFALKIK